MPEYSPDVCRELADKFAACDLLRPLRVDHYDAGTELSYDMTGVTPPDKANVTLTVDKFIGGGFAGQVYRVVVTSLTGPCGGLEVGKRYAMKILVPPSRGGRIFRDAIYKVGFQSPFSGQVNHAAARAGALWQKLIRRAAQLKFGSEQAVKDIHATFADAKIGSYGEISEWVEGRNWRFEADDQVDSRKARLEKIRQGKCSGPSSEYLSKKVFMDEFVKMLYEMGAPEFARQYYWWTCKSQPNVFKRTNTEDDPCAGLTAMDFRAGLALLPFLPMSPGDVALIFKGIARGSLVQFDRPDIARFKRFIEKHHEEFADLTEATEELLNSERVYRDSMIDVTHNHVRLLHDARLWRGISDAAVESWKVRNITDTSTDAAMKRSRLRTFMFAMLGVIPLLGRKMQTLLGRADLRAHYARMLTSANYMGRAIRGHLYEKIIKWHRKGRISRQRAMRLADAPWRAMLEIPLSFLPVFLHKWLTDLNAFRNAMRYVFVRPVKLYFNADARQQWMRDMIDSGLDKGMLTQDEARDIRNQLDDDYIQKYLKALAVHVCTAPITQLVSVILGIYLAVRHGGGMHESMAIIGTTVAIFQVIPISPGSIARGSYVVYLAIRERNIRDYNIAIFLGFFKYIGYLAFPIQMAYRYPNLARFMAGHWSTGAVHIIPVFGEHGALPEHATFDLFYNRPLTVRRRMNEVAQHRRTLNERTIHALPIAVACAIAVSAVELASFHIYGTLPTLKNIWWAVILIPAVFGSLTTLWAGSLTLQRRMLLVLKSALVMAIVSTGARLGLNWWLDVKDADWIKHLTIDGMWRIFLFGLIAAAGALRLETRLRAPRVQGELPVTEKISA